MEMVLPYVREYGGWVVLLLWAVQIYGPRMINRQEFLEKRKLAQEDRVSDKVGELYERLLVQQERTLSIIDENSNIIGRNTAALDRNSLAVGEMREAIQEEFPQIAGALRDLTGRVARLESRVCPVGMELGE